MLAPPLMARIKEFYHLACHWVNRFDAIPFVIVAIYTGQPEVVLVGLAPTRFWEQVFDSQEHATQPLRRQTIATAVPRLLSDLLAQGLRDIGFAHGCSKSGLTSCPDLGAAQWHAPAPTTLCHARVAAAPTALFLPRSVLPAAA